MAKRTKPTQDSKPQLPAQVTGQQAATEVDQDMAASGTGAQAPANDAPPEQKSDAEAPETMAGASGTSDVAQGDNAPPPPVAAGEFVTIGFPLPKGTPLQALASAWVVVKAKPARGRWRAGRQFTREETAIPYRELSEDQIAALTGDAELIVTLRVEKPA